MNSHKAGFQDIWSLGDDQPQNRKVVCEIGPSDTKWGDAFLIAAAPLLLQAAKDAFEQLRISRPQYDTAQSRARLNAIKEQLATAILKATP